MKPCLSLFSPLLLSTNRISRQKAPVFGLFGKKWALIRDADCLVRASDGLVRDADCLVHEADGLVHEADSIVRASDCVFIRLRDNPPQSAPDALILKQEPVAA